MKKTFTILIAAIAAILMMALPKMAVGQDPTASFTVTGLSSVPSSFTSSPTGFTMSVAANGGTTPAQNSGSLRLYAKNQMTIGSTDGTTKIKTVTLNMKINASSGKYPGISAPSGSFSPSSVTTLTSSITWTATGDGTPTITFTFPQHTNGVGGNWTFSAISLTYESGGGGTTTYTLSSAVTPSGAGTVALSKTSLEEDETATATATANAHFSFTSWSIAGEGATLSSPTTNPTTVTMGMANATVTATFTEDPKYNITYNANYTGATDEPVVVSNYAGESVTIASYSTFTRAGYAITSWNTAAEGNGTQYSAGDSYTMTSAGLTLYAQWEESNEVVDELTVSWTGVTSTSYSIWSDKSVENGSGAVYAGKTSKLNNGIGLRTEGSDCGIITTTSGGNVRKVVVTWTSTSARTLQVYGKNTAYTGVSELFNSSNQGELLGTIVYGTSTELTISGDYAYVGLRSASGALSLEPIKITWEHDNDPAVPTSITINDENLNNDCGNSNTNGGSLSATVYNDQNAIIDGASVTWESSNTNAATIDPTTGAVTLVAVGTTTITASYAGVANEYKPSEQTYTLNVVDSYASGGLHNPYTVAQARAAITAANGETLHGKYATGIISEVVYYSGNNHYITYNISDDGATTSNQLQAFHGKGINGANFTSEDDLQKGDVVVIYGDLLYYSQNSTYEFAADNQLVSLVRKTIAVTPASIEAPAAGTTGTLTIATENMTISDLSDFSVQYYDNQGQEINDPGWITFGEFSGNGDSFSVGYTIATTTEARNAYFKVFTYSDEIYSNLINVSQAAPASTEYYQYSINGIEGDLFQTTTGTEIELPATVNNIPSGFTFAGWTIDADDIEHIIAGGTNYTINTTVEFYAVFAKNVPVTFSYTIVPNNFPGNSYANNDGEHSVTATSSSGVATKTVSYTSSNVMKNNTSGVLTIQWKKDNNNPGEIYNESSYGTITSVEVEETSTEALTIVIGESVHPTEASNNGGYFSIKNNGTNTGRASSVTITFIQSVPYYYTRVFPANPTVTGPITISGPTIITSGSVLDMGSYTLTSNNAANLIIEDGAQLILANTNANVKATVKKSITAAVVPNSKAGEAPFGWYSISSSVNNAKIAGEGANTNLITTTSAPYDFDLYRYNETVSAEQWENYHASNTEPFTNMTNGRGYLYRNANNVTIEFTGTVNTGNVEYTVTKSDVGALSGFNLIGNPYTHDIYKGTGGAIVNSVENGYELATGYYVATNSGAWEAKADNTDPIVKNQGILVQAVKAGTITMTNTPNGYIDPNAKANHDNIKFMVANSQYEDVAYAMFDKGNGLNKISHRNAEIPMLYIPQNDENYAIAMMSDDTQSFGLNFKAMTMGKYTLSYKADGQFSYLHVIDRLTGEDVDMLLEESYSFVGTPKDAENRFIVKLNYQSGLDSSDNSTFAYQSGNDIIVSGEGTLQIFDVMGRMIATQNINGVETVNVPANGVYVFRLNEKVQKVVVK